MCVNIPTPVNRRLSVARKKLRFISSISDEKKISQDGLQITVALQKQTYWFYTTAFEMKTRREKERSRSLPEVMKADGP